MQIYQQFGVNIALPVCRDSGTGAYLQLLRFFSACYFNKNETLAQVFSC